MSKQRFASQVDVNNNLSRPVTQHYFPKRRESAFAKPNDMIASSKSMNNSKNMPRFSLKDMVHNHYLDEARKKTQERDRNSKTSVMPFARFQSIADGSKPKPRSNNQTPRSLPKTSPRSDLRWKPTGRTLKTVGLRWIIMGKILVSCTSKDDSEPTHGSNVDIPTIYECKQTLDLSAEVPSTDMIVMTSMIELESLFGPFFDEYFNGENKVVSMSSVVTTADASDKRQQQPDSTSSTSILATTVTADGNFNMNENKGRMPTKIELTLEQSQQGVNDDVLLQALVDGKKIIITESTVRRDLQLEDVEGLDCLPNATIFEQLTLMGYEKISQKLTFYKAFFSSQWKFLVHTILQCLSSKTTAWNEFSSTMASAIICLATNQKFNFLKYIFESMVKNLDNARIFLMYPRFVQVFLDKQLEGMSNHNTIYVTPSHTKKIFRNMRRVLKGFSGRETPLFQTMVVQAQEEIGEETRTRKPKIKDTQIPQSSGPTDNVADEAVNEEMDDSLERAVTTASSLDAEQDRGGGPRCQETMGDTIAQTRGGSIADIDVDEDITLVNDQDDADMFGVNDLDGDEVIVDNVDVVKTTEETVSAATTTATKTDVEVTLAQALAEFKSAKPKAVKVVIQELEQGITTTTPITIISIPKPPRDKGKVIMIEEPVMEQVKPIKRLEQIRLDEELLAQRLQAQEKEELTDEEKAKLFVQFLEQRRKYFTAKRAEEKRNGPLTRAQQRSIMCTYRKNMEGWKPKNLKNMSFANIQELFDKAMKKVNTFVDYRTELVEESSKKAEAEIAQESKVVSDDEEEVAIDVVPLATKPPTIVDWKIHKEEKKSYYQIIKANGKSQMYRVFSQMLKSFSREDLKDLYKLVKAKYGSTRPLEDLDLILWGDLKTIVHSLRKQNVYIYMLVEKRYPLTPSTITDMLNKKLQGRIVRIKRFLDDLRVTAAKRKIPPATAFRTSWVISLRPAKHRLEIHFHVEKRLGFLQGVDQKELGKESDNESDNFILDVSVFKLVTYSEEFVNVIVMIGFDSTIKLVSFDKSHVVTFNSKFVCGFRNGDCRTGSQSDNTVGSQHGFVIHGIKVLKSNEKVTEVIDVENWRVDNSRVFRWIVSLFERNSSVSSTKSSIQSMFRFR
ncbi:hypothetical protein Tco_0296814 [Tanacetum coccineum]